LVNILFVLGKTVEILALIALMKSNQNQDFHIPNPKEKSKYNSRVDSTLILVPPTLIGQWWDDILKHLDGISAAVCTPLDLVINHDDENDGVLYNCNLKCNCNVSCVSKDTISESASIVNLISKHDIILSTYSVFQKRSNPKKHSPLKGILKETFWKRIVLDECQEIRSVKSFISKECCQLFSSHR
jgi:SNF2 family DNA or RNA helicase